MAFFDGFRDTVQLLKNTFAVLKKNPGIVKPTIREAWFLGITFLVILMGLALVNFKIAPTAGMALMIAAILFLAIPFPFIKIHYKAAQCWMVYKTFSGEKVTFKEGLERAKLNRKDVFVLGLIDIVVRMVVGQARQGSRKQGLAGLIITLIMRLIGKIIEEGWDLIGHYLLPAAIIREQTVREALPEIKNIKNNVPGALAGVFGFDFVGKVIDKYIFLFLLPFLVLTVFLIPKFGWIPVAVFMIFAVALLSAISIAIDMGKMVYFTLFYMSITMPENISKQYRSEVTNYLLSNKGRHGTAGRPIGNI